LELKEQVKTPIKPQQEKRQRKKKYHIEAQYKNDVILTTTLVEQLVLLQP
jgi:hypothetical protein